MSEPQYLTADGAEKMREELAHLKGPEREAIALRLRNAIEMGDLSENADYSMAKEDQAFLEGRILELEYVLGNAIIIDESQRKRDSVDVGTTVTVQQEDFPPDTYMLVGAKEADPPNGRISNESPIGKALLGRRAGETVSVETPGGKISLKILEIK